MCCPKLPLTGTKGRLSSPPVVRRISPLPDALEPDVRVWRFGALVLPDPLARLVTRDALLRMPVVALSLAVLAVACACA